MSGLKRENATAVELLKTFAVSTPHVLPDMNEMVRRMFFDKGFDPYVAKRMAASQSFGFSFVRLLLHNPPGTAQAGSLMPEANLAGLFNFIGSTLPEVKPSIRVKPYRGTPEQCAAIDRALANSGHRNIKNDIQGEGATSYFNPNFIYASSNGAMSVPIAVVGYGAAGILVAYALQNIGFNNVSILEKAKEALGIWSHKNVHEGTKNNPRTLTFLSKALEAAPGAGLDVRNFLNAFAQERVTLKVDRIVPVNFAHQLISDTSAQPRVFPIVINTMGLGDPRALSDSQRMTSNITATAAGPRWQQRLTAEEVRGRHYLFVGLGNSTAEMMRQLHSYMDLGIDTDYTVLTHYPKDSVWNPRAVVNHKGSSFRVFRDLSRLNLVDFQGDLPDSLKDYNRALYGDRIVCGVKKFQWYADAPVLVTFNEDGKKIREIKYDKMFTLTGYKHRAATFQKFGIEVDESDCPLYDYDGEFIHDSALSGGDRVYKGYFGIGSVLDAPHNTNAVVIPGIFHRLADLLFGVIMRAEEYVSRDKQ